MLMYDYYKEKNFQDGDINLEPFEGGVEYEHCGGEGICYDEETNKLIPERYRNEDGSYELGELIELNYFFAPDDIKEKYLEDKLRRDLRYLLSKKRKRLEAPYKKKIEEIEAEMKKEIGAALEKYEARVRDKLGLSQ